ncbi:MAG: hypothetical protein RML74_07420 [Acidobacteriota bacterium]|nr:hypothetical protein [Acidobacteriota bacterium]
MRRAVIGIEEEELKGFDPDVLRTLVYDQHVRRGAIAGSENRRMDILNSDREAR